MSFLQIVHLLNLLVDAEGIYPQCILYVKSLIYMHTGLKTE